MSTPHMLTIFCGLSQFHRLALAVLETTFSDNKSREMKVQKLQVIQFSKF